MSLEKKCDYCTKPIKVNMNKGDYMHYVVVFTVTPGKNRPKKLHYHFPKCIEKAKYKGGLLRRIK